MTLALVVLLIVTVVGSYAVIDRKDTRMKAERDAHRKEVQTLLNRLANPQVQVPVETPKATGPHHLPFDDDGAWNKWLEDMQPMEQMS